MSYAYNSFINYIEQKIIVSPDLKRDLASLSDVIVVKKNHFLLREDQIPQHLYFIEKGSVRVYYYHDDKEVTSWIYTQEQLVTSFGSFFNQTVSYDNIQCTEDCTLVGLSYKNLMQLYETHPEMQKFGRLFLEEIVMIIDHFSRGFVFMSAKEKYDLIQEYFPDIINRVNLGYIASWMGVNQATLSRIRALR